MTGIRLWRWLAPVLVVALGVGAGLAFVAAGSVRAVALSVARTPAPSAGHQPCLAVQVYFRDDDAMRRAAAVLGNDPKARRVDLDPQALTWAEFKKIYQQDPAKIAATSESAMPATVVVLPVPGTDLTRYAAELKQRFPDAQKVQQLDVEAVWKKYHPGMQGFVCA
ncbi:hypothetical protein AB0K15_08935 [Amycolatopsis sp. NPDC049253]|uniref:hypothetical protein n=1 Tax=Amycolatopsis sp. NPDC049253 TaxID=3155274 RepID=UPI00344A0593